MSIGLHIPLSTSYEREDVSRTSVARYQPFLRLNSYPSGYPDNPFNLVQNAVHKVS
jgi:hypothetical protein